MSRSRIVPVLGLTTAKFRADPEMALSASPGIRAALRRLLAAGLLAVAVTMIAPVSPAAAAPLRIRFTRGAITWRAIGQLTRAHQDARYLVAARAGQHMLVHTTGLTSARDLAHAFTTIAVVTRPSGTQDGQKGAVSFDETLTETGDYLIRVGPNMMASNVRGGPYLVEVVIY